MKKLLSSYLFSILLLASCASLIEDEKVLKVERANSIDELLSYANSEKGVARDRAFIKLSSSENDDRIINLFANNIDYPNNDIRADIVEYLCKYYESRNSSIYLALVQSSDRSAILALLKAFRKHDLKIDIELQNAICNLYNHPSWEIRLYAAAVNAQNGRYDGSDATIDIIYSTFSVAKRLAAESARLFRNTKMQEALKAYIATVDDKTAQDIAAQSLAILTSKLDSRPKTESNKNEELVKPNFKETESNAAPKLVVTSPQDLYQTDLEEIQLEGIVIDDEEVSTIEIRVNDILLQDESARGLKVVRAKENSLVHCSVPLVFGKNHIAIAAIDRNGRVGKAELTIVRAKSKGLVWAVVIGVSEYQHVDGLQYAAEDAKAFFEYLVAKKVASSNILLILNKEATLSNIKSFLGTKLKAYSGASDTVIIYYAGHGAAEPDTESLDGDGFEKYLLPYDADLNDLYSTALPMREIINIFNRIQSDRLIFIADTCFSGASGGRTVLANRYRAPLNEGYLNRVSKGKGRIVLAACRANELSIESRALKHGVFTYYLLQALGGRAATVENGLVSVNEAFSYISKMVPNATNQRQHPIMKGEFEGDIYIEGDRVQ